MPFKEGKSGQTHFCEDCERAGRGGAQCMKHRDAMMDEAIALASLAEHCIHSSEGVCETCESDMAIEKFRSSPSGLNANSDFLQVGRTMKCHHCTPLKYILPTIDGKPYEYKCDCVCHDKLEDQTVEEKVYQDIRREAFEECVKMCKEASRKLEGLDMDIEAPDIINDLFKAIRNKIK